MSSEFDPIKSEYNIRRAVIADIVRNLIDSHPQNRRELVKALDIEDSFDDIQRRLMLIKEGLKIYKPIKTIDAICEILEGDPGDWKVIPTLKTLDLAGGHGDLYRESRNPIKPYYPFLTLFLSLLGADATNIDIGPKPEELPESFKHLKRDIYTDLIKKNPEIPGINPHSLDVITCFNFCTWHNVDPDLFWRVGKNELEVLRMYKSILRFAESHLVQGGLLIIDGEDHFEVWTATNGNLSEVAYDSWKIGP